MQFSWIFFWLPFCQVNGQVIMGVIKDVQTQIPISGLEVQIIDVDRHTTDDSGFYRLDLSRCQWCKTNPQVKVRIYSPTYGYHEEDLNINTINPTSHDISVLRSPTQLNFIGVVKEKISGDPVKGVFVKPQQIPNFNGTQKTDQFGEFQFQLDQRNVGALPYLSVLIQDTTGRCAFKDNVRIPVNFISEVYMDCKPKPVEVPIDDAGKEMLRHTNKKAKYLESEIIETGQFFVTLRINYRYEADNNTILKLGQIIYEGQNTAEVKCFLEDYNRKMVRLEVLKTDKPMTWTSDSKGSVSSELLANFVKYNMQ